MTTKIQKGLTFKHEGETLKVLRFEGSMVELRVTSQDGNGWYWREKSQVRAMLRSRLCQIKKVA